MNKLTIVSLDEKRYFKATTIDYTVVSEAVLRLKQELMVRAIDYNIQYEEYLQLKKELLACETLKDAYNFVNNAPNFFNEYVQVTYRSYKKGI
jgi:hypothetical protein